jgi:hypothetical protein
VRALAEGVGLLAPVLRHDSRDQAASEGVALINKDFSQPLARAFT